MPRFFLNDDLFLPAEMSANEEQTVTNSMLGRRLLDDIKEIQQNPYPGIDRHIDESNLAKVCLVLTPANEPALHLTLEFPPTYPLDPPRANMNSKVDHPNVFGGYICMSLLKGGEGYTPAYTLKGICIQILSFFASDVIEQWFDERIDRAQYKREGEELLERLKLGSYFKDDFQCRKCGFGLHNKAGEQEMDTALSTEGHHSTTANGTGGAGAGSHQYRELTDMPNEILLAICDHLEGADLFHAAEAYSRFGRVMQTYNVIRTRELQCFIFKQGFNQLDLGIGVVASSRPRAIESEFDLISRQAYADHGVRQAVIGLKFDFWLPLPLAASHWQRVKGSVSDSLNAIARRADIQGPLDTVIYAFMNEIVVRLSKDAEAEEEGATRYKWAGDGGLAIKSTLTHASEKAVESYFHLFHLLLCLATDNPAIAQDANQLIYDFLTGTRNKQRVPNLGHLLIAILISDVEASEELTKAIIVEAVTRNVVWMLNGNPELAFLETSDISHYRLQKTFEAGKTSYRLLMFLNLMRQVVRKSRTEIKTNEAEAGVKIERKMTLEELKNSLFIRHGAPPNGSAAYIANKVREIQKINGFPGFLQSMGMGSTSPTFFTKLLRHTIEKSHERGFSAPVLTQEEALYLRLEKEPGVHRPVQMVARQPKKTRDGTFNFFPRRGGQQGGRGGARGGARGGRGRGRGQY